MVFSVQWNFVCFPIILRIIIEQFYFIGFNRKRVGLRGVLTGFRDLMAFHEVEFGVFKIGRSEGALEVFEVKRRGYF